jgi:hypothetical protein
MMANDVTFKASPEKLSELDVIHTMWEGGLVTLSEYVFKAKAIGYTIITPGVFLNDAVEKYANKIFDAPVDPNIDKFVEYSRLKGMFIHKSPLNLRPS